MFSVKEKQLIAKKIEELLLSLDHPEMPKTRPFFMLRVIGAETWSWAEILPNWTLKGQELHPNSWNENAREIMEKE
jgi:hypothetical protein